MESSAASVWNEVSKKGVVVIEILAAAVFVFILGLIAMWESYALVKVVRRTGMYGDVEVQIAVSRLFRKPKTVRYRGSVTVWHIFPSGKRANTQMERRISEWVKADQFERQIYEATTGEYYPEPFGIGLFPEIPRPSEFVKYSGSLEEE